MGAIQLLLGKGAKIDHQNQKGETPLMRAARQGHVEAMKALILAGANPDLKDQEGRTIFEVVKGVRPEDLKELLRKGDEE